MSLISDIEECLSRPKINAHQTTPIPSSVVDDLVAKYGPLPPSIAAVVTKIGKAELFWDKSDFPGYNMAVCYKLQISRVIENEYYLNVGYWIYGAAVYYRWCPKKEAEPKTSRLDS